MSSRKPAKDSAGKAKKLTLNKKTLKDRAPRKAHTADVRGGAAGSRQTVGYGC